MSSDRSAVVDGGLASLSANFPLLYEYAAVYVDKLLKGANPASLPVEQPGLRQPFDLLAETTAIAAQSAAGNRNHVLSAGAGFPADFGGYSGATLRRLDDVTPLGAYRSFSTGRGHRRSSCFTPGPADAVIIDNTTETPRKPIDTPYRPATCRFSDHAELPAKPRETIHRPLELATSSIE
jgi:hypothetical protein